MGRGLEEKGPVYHRELWKQNFTVLLKYGLGYSFSMNLCLYIVR